MEDACYLNNKSAVKKTHGFSTALLALFRQFHVLYPFFN
ncbi:ferric transporter ATP-binding subunit [Aggregatibacter aphrophilus NJ8700]|nr:ferric transporter ATP-binding subunit [Aggregatibacter aphrophilus NJ8700]